MLSSGGGSHPDELLPLDIVESLRQRGIAGVDGDIVNTSVPRGVRWRVLNGRVLSIGWLYPGNRNSEIEEERRAAEVLEENKHYDLVIDGHEAYHGGGGLTSAGHCHAAC